MATIKLVIDGAQLENMLHGRDGAINRFMVSRATIVQKAAKEDCPVLTGDLKKSINKRPSVRTPTGLDISIIADQPYAAAVHNGAQPHDIPNAWGKGQDFGIGANLKTPRPFFHPGNKPNPFLAKNLRLFTAF